MQSFGHDIAVAFMNTQQKWLPVNLHNTEFSDIPSWHHGGQGAKRLHSPRRAPGSADS